MKHSIRTDWEQGLLDRMGAMADFKAATFPLRGQMTTLYYLSSLVNLPETLSTIERLIETSTSVPPSHEMLLNSLLAGKVIVRRTDDEAPIVILPVGLDINRQIVPAQTEQPLQSSFDSFTEDVNTNIGLIRKRMGRADLIVESFVTGTSRLREIVLVYVGGEANPNVVKFMKSKLSKNLRNDIHNVSDLLKTLEQPKISLVPTYLTTELPEESVQNMHAGKVIVFIDQFPHALAFPAIIRDLWALKSDLNNPSLFRMFYRALRIAGILFSIVTPSFYIILNAVNPELLRIQLALSVAKSREGVPYPSIVEVVLMLILIEMVIEATIRLPKSIGPTITMIGGIILGQAIVQAQLVSNLLIIILATSTIANFTVAGFLNTVGIRLFKYGALLLSTLFGVFGLEISILWFCVYLAGLNTIAVPYLSLNLKGQASYD
ncbi:spore germination protein [Cohnella herbarum]|uniref:Spore germination protein n=1 Tax=Cohnella herbarum TaxID=2728023 RepID=A0A7Z2VFH5_9BACL|nr:spore germination protein [Cohnella herbarum]QJD82062.1 spore germination protein [Cohnella herbarum]